jgi:hypothetical protein
MIATEIMNMPRRSSARPATVPAPGTMPVEETLVHTRILRMALSAQESRAYWAQVDPAVPPASRAVAAFQGRWFGGKSLDRVRLLLANFVARYDAFPPALDVLRRWRGMDQSTRLVVCHVHLQLSDPIYRSFTGRFLPDRRARPHMTLDREGVLRWLDDQYEGRWGTATRIQFASKLLSAASEAGLVSPKQDRRELLSPRIPDLALAYVLYLLRGVRFDGALFDNDYLLSLGLAPALLEARIRALPGLRFGRMGELVDVQWEHRDLAAWGERYIVGTEAEGG